MKEKQGVCCCLFTHWDGKHRRLGSPLQASEPLLLQRKSLQELHRGAARVAVHVSLLACSRAEPALSFLREPHGCAGLFCMVVTHSDVS